MFGPILISALSFWSVALAGAFYWTRRYVRAVQRQAAALDQIAALDARLRRLETSQVETAELIHGNAAPRQIGDRKMLITPGETLPSPDLAPPRN